MVFVGINFILLRGVCMCVGMGVGVGISVGWWALHLLKQCIHLCVHVRACIALVSALLINSVLF